MRRLAILGAGGHGRVVADCAAEAGWDQIAFFDDGAGLGSGGPWPLLGGSDGLLSRLGEYDGVIVGIGRNAIRLDWHRRLKARGARMVSVVHPGANVSRYASLGEGSVVVAGAIINIASRIGDAVIVNTGATVDHDNELADGVHVSPGAHLAGGVRVGFESWIGIGATVREMIAIGNNVQVGAGSVVVKSLPDNVVVVGNPARLLRK